MAIFVKRLDQIRKRDHKYIGNKTANIVALLREELSTPPGFSVGSQAYREFLGNSGLAKQLARLAGEAATGSMPELEQASRKIHRIILSQNVYCSLN